MKAPNPEALAKMWEAVRGYDWKGGERRLREAMARMDRSEKPRRDGYPKVTMAGPGSRNGHSDPTSDVAVDAASAMSSSMGDPLATHTAAALRALGDHIKAADRFMAELAFIDRMSFAEDAPCCSVLRPFGVTEEVFRDGLGRWAYEYKRRHDGELPTRVEVEAHINGKRVR